MGNSRNFTRRVPSVGVVGLDPLWNRDNRWSEPPTLVAGHLRRLESGLPQENYPGKRLKSLELLMNSGAFSIPPRKNQSGQNCEAQ